MENKAVVSEDFKRKIWLDYPLPERLSVWGGDGVNTVPLKNIDDLITMCVEDVASDIVVRAELMATGITTKLPQDTVTVMYANMDYPFQGNRQVKVSYDHSTKVAMMRYTPARIVYQRKMHVEDIDKLQGDRLIYFRYYVMNKMAVVELNYLKTMDMTIDNGTIDLATLEKFAEETAAKVKELKEDTILLYSPSNG